MNCKKWQALGKASAIAMVSLILNGTTAIAQEKGKWVTLFDGKSLNGWHSWQSDKVLPQWKIEDKAIVLAEKGGKDLVTDKEYGDFELELEWKIAEGGNSGIIYHVIEDKKYCCPYSTGPEIQVLDDEKHPDSKAGKAGNHKSGSLYDMLPPNDIKVVKPAGQWNKAKIVIKGGHGESWLNGKKVVDFPTQGADWDKLVAGSKFKTWEGFGASSKGKIALQDHGNQVSFRNIRIKEL
ncbi:3-keto-disaccharide hydrolase [Dyadobacter arcticus]|uniref:3-keto-alpha-glucoside-1,2-lyase/3-keto-2-hydroxy-glucal hydratase domain-containing protein n=1 Tax=Dyadobacter arcticus TaxID=1078754 RepID=A0ABX0UF00_9BACT|nr:DUF1080 domain-containing protein [Dyadobacter arcticus]NIJ51551.1 hypothetical protein [Dyadobacter arcticus]